MCHSTNLVERFPTQLGQLSSRIQLDLSGDASIRGTHPTHLCRLPHLPRLSLGSNTLSGAIPSQLGHLSSTVAMARLERQYLQWYCTE